MLHTQFWCLWKEDPLGFTIHHPELIMLKKIKSYRDWSALKKIVPHWYSFLFHIKIHEISPGAIQKSNGLRVTCLMSLYFKSEEDTMKNDSWDFSSILVLAYCAKQLIFHSMNLKTWLSKVCLYGNLTYFLVSIFWNQTRHTAMQQEQIFSSVK